MDGEFRRDWRQTESLGNSLGRNVIKSRGVEWRGTQFPDRACPRRGHIGSKAPPPICGNGFNARFVSILRGDDSRADLQKHCFHLTLPRVDRIIRATRKWRPLKLRRSLPPVIPTLRQRDARIDSAARASIWHNDECTLQVPGSCYARVAERCWNHEQGGRFLDQSHRVHEGLQ